MKAFVVSEALRGRTDLGKEKLRFLNSSQLQTKPTQTPSPKKTQKQSRLRPRPPQPDHVLGNKSRNTCTVTEQQSRANWSSTHSEQLLFSNRCVNISVQRRLEEEWKKLYVFFFLSFFQKQTKINIKWAKHYVIRPPHHFTNSFWYCSIFFLFTSGCYNAVSVYIYPCVYTCILYVLCLYIYIYVFCMCGLTCIYLYLTEN